MDYNTLVQTSFMVATVDYKHTGDMGLQNKTQQNSKQLPRDQTSSADGANRCTKARVYRGTSVFRM